MPSFSSYDGCLISYELAGRGAPLVVLPGGPGSHVGYVGGLGGLDGRRQLVLVHPRGTGRSAVPADRSSVSFVQQARDVEELRRHLGLERLDLLAHSAGCLVAQEYLAGHPGRVPRAVLVTPVGVAGREPDEAELAALRAARAAEPWYPQAAEAARRLAGGGVGAAEAAELNRRILPFFWYGWSERHFAEYRPEHAAAPWYREAFYAGAAEARPPAERRARIAAGGTRSLVLAGAFDGMVGPAPAPARAVAAALPDARLEVLERSGHRPWAEEPERFVALVDGFLDRRMDRCPDRCPDRPAEEAPVSRS
ncbi:alpha/beta fold hydrolase [Kitasatospora sp. NPDC058162]|uniref:alpha/beta fold hydrolase n=1 Tax=Kitasatospora sp. NPDC058162 TaxID=3346362 RepID=UPI0036DD822C